MRKELESFIDAEGTRFWRVWFQIVRREACVAPGEISGTQRPDGPFASVRKSRAIGGIIRADARPVPVLRTRSPKSHAAHGELGTLVLFANSRAAPAHLLARCVGGQARRRYGRPSWEGKLRRRRHCRTSGPGNPHDPRSRDDPLRGVESLGAITWETRSHRNTFPDSRWRRPRCRRGSSACRP